MYPNVWGGFLRYDELGRIALDLADQVVRSQDGLRYTLTIREGATASGNPVVAEHFLASWNRALDPANLSPMVAFMEPVRGFDAWIAGEEGAELGFSAPTIGPSSSSWTSHVLPVASFVWSVVDPAILEVSGDENFVLNGAGTGPWQFVEYERDTRFVMEPNPNYYDPLSPSLTHRLAGLQRSGRGAHRPRSLSRRERGVRGRAPLPPPEVEEDPVLSAELTRLDRSQATIRSLAMDFRQPPFDDVRVRRAFGLAFDRDRYSEIYEGTWTPATVFTPPVVTELSGYQPPEDSPSIRSRHGSCWPRRVLARGCRRSSSINRLEIATPSWSACRRCCRCSRTTSG